MKIAIIGGGISGLVCAKELSPHHQVTVFEANHYPGGHTNTIDVEDGPDVIAVDTGFIVFNEKTYPNFLRLIRSLGVSFKPTPMSFSVKCDATGLEYRGADLNGVFAQRKNFLNFRFLKMLKDLVRFNKTAQQLIEGDTDEELTVGEFFAREKLSKMLLDKYFVPMCAAVWSCPAERILEFPVRFIIDFFHNHGLLDIRNRPEWYVIRGGSREYVKVLIKSFENQIRLNSPVSRVVRSESEVLVTSPKGVERFDQVIFACHSDQALRILADGATSIERELVGAFGYQPNEAVLHTDTSLLPKSKRAWACWNYHLPEKAAAASPAATVTYNMNILQGLAAERTYCVTLNETESIDPAKILRVIQYDHPIFTTRRKEAQTRHREVIGVNRTSFCGAYWANGFHEDGVVSALRVCEVLNEKPSKENEQLHLSGKG